MIVGLLPTGTTLPSPGGMSATLPTRTLPPAAPPLVLGGTRKPTIGVTTRAAIDTMERPARAVRNRRRGRRPPVGSVAVRPIAPPHHLTALASGSISPVEGETRGSD